ncbi:hypothetical protein BDY21DRAFT_373127 [Lineolata rhizophorae]|uniref:CCHC-type domain-containing protein n=1 Tax=Lineolata rhizophorae TaxID=578093 RepID=A0A6A6NVG6_9PEZI|nr:hypothetical protein BDY21DRAFT_373127 [Lineolata rhizophorae]
MAQPTPPPQPAKQIPNLQQQFMQRSASRKTSHSSPSTPTRSTDAPPTPPNAAAPSPSSSPRPSKRARISDTTGPAAAEGPPPPPPSSELDNAVLVDTGAAVRAALAAEEEARRAALERAAEAAGESRWVLSFREEGGEGGGGRLASGEGDERGGLRVRVAGWGELDGGDEEDEADEGESQVAVVGRKRFGEWKTEPSAHEKARKEEESSEDDSDEDSSDEDEVDDAPAGAAADPSGMIRAERLRAERQAEREKKVNSAAAQMATGRRSHDFQPNSNRFMGISSGGGGSGLGGRGGISMGSRLSSGGGSADWLRNVECHRCGQKGHMMRECPNPRRGGTGRRR